MYTSEASSEYSSSRSPRVGFVVTAFSSMRRWLSVCSSAKYTAEDAMRMSQVKPLMSPVSCRPRAVMSRATMGTLYTEHTDTTWSRVSKMAMGMVL